MNVRCFRNDMAISIDSLYEKKYVKKCCEQRTGGWTHADNASQTLGEDHSQNHGVCTCRFLVCRQIDDG